ncbi:MULTISPECIES: carboxylate--amine ligase [unclassified Isoptericola]|uniref:carboxylate--amine ligase n=1 Tax=unclassified Isoptericola TaxID=2623355 RepID=UPI0036517CA0
MSRSTAPEPRPELAPVILGGDIGVYALGRAFHELYGVTSTVISGLVPGPIADSRILRTVQVEDSHDARGLVDAALKVAAETLAADPGRRLLLLANSDWLVRTVVRHRGELEAAGYVVPFLDEELLDDISDKATFAELAEKVGIAVPRTIVQDFAGADDPSWQPVPVDVGWPLIAKAASSADYQDVEFPGKRKVFEIGTQAELDDLWRRLREAGFRGRFVAQELVPGDDTQMRSITAYVDGRGVATLMAGAHVLLEEHTPNGLGNPAAMITGDLGTMFDQARAFLAATGYRGFANFDIKVDPRDGSFAFFEVNPRIGRNNYYVTAAGANVARFVVADHVDGVALEPVVVTREVLYSILPTSLLLRYVREDGLRAKVRRLAPDTAHPLAYWAADGGAKRRAYVAAAKVNQVRKFRQWYPEPTGTGF